VVISVSDAIGGLDTLLRCSHLVHGHIEIIVGLTLEEWEDDDRW